MENLEKRILKELKYGGIKAFEFVFKTYYYPLCKYADEILSDPDQAEDLVETLFIIIWEERKKIDIHTSLRSYLYRSTYNACLNVLRKRKSERRYHDFFIDHAGLSNNHDYGSLSYPLSGIIEREMEENLNKVINDLPPQCKRIFLMSRVDEMSHQAIAKKLDLSVSTVKGQVMIALKKIQNALKDLTY